MKFLYTFLFISFLSCSHKVTQKDLGNLNGYWDIEMVESASKKITKFGINSTIDYYHLEETNQGYRKKVKPDFSGKYRANNIEDKIIVTHKNEHFVIHTTTALDSWDDIIIELTKEKLILQNDKGVLFHYKKHEKYNF
jgi:hypothetical protein